VSAVDRNLSTLSPGVCIQVLTILALVILTIAAKVWQVLPLPLKILLVLTLADYLAAHTRQRDPHQAQPLPISPGEEQRYSQYEQPSVSVSYPEMILPPTRVVSFRDDLHSLPVQAGAVVQFPARHSVFWQTRKPASQSMTSR